MDKVFSRLAKVNLKLKKAKCLFFQNEVPFVGMWVSGTGVEPLSEKLTAIKDFPVPTDVKSLKGFLGTAGFYHRFAEKFFHIAAPLTDLLRKTPSNTKKLDCNPDAENAFQALKIAMQKAVCLAYPSPTAEIELTFDASLVAAGGVVHQVEMASSAH